jgi:hypothetical protein
MIYRDSYQELSQGHKSGIENLSRMFNKRYDKLYNSILLRMSFQDKNHYCMFLVYIHYQPA